MTAALLACWLALAPQGDPTDAVVLAKFDALPVLRQAMLVRRVEQQLVDGSDVAARRVAALRVDPATLPEAPAAVHFDPKEWAPVAPARFIIPTSDARNQAVRRAMPSVAVLPDLARGVRYDWLAGRVVKATPLGWRARFTNLLHGYPPGADEAYARVLAALDHSKSQRKLADFFEHTYADRQAGVYEGVTMYEAWYAGEVMEMPDVDAIAFAVRVLGDTSYVSPIPGELADDLYGKMKVYALAHRQYRTMLEAAAAAFVRAEPSMDPMYARMAPRFHYLFATHGDDLARVREALVTFKTRDAMIKSVDSTVVEDEAALARRDSRRQELATMATTVRTRLLEGLAEEKAAPQKGGGD